MLTIHSITPVPTRSRADDALAYALDRLLPELNHLELEHIRQGLRERGFDVQALVREAR